MEVVVWCRKVTKYNEISKFNKSLELWFDVGKLRNTTSRSSFSRSFLLWFDVGKLRNTTEINDIHCIKKLWFDVGKLRNTTQVIEPAPAIYVVVWCRKVTKYNTMRFPYPRTLLWFDVGKLRNTTRHYKTKWRKSCGLM